MLLRSLRARRRRTQLLVTVTATLTLAAAAACGIDAVATKEFPEGPDASETGVVVLPPKPDGEVDDGGVDALPDVDAAKSCPTGHGAMVVVDAGGLFFCIDATEVTNAEYDKFVTATDGGSVDSGKLDGDAPPSCAFNMTYVPGVVGAANFPVVSVDWCDAEGYCRWAGKRLCGKQVNHDASTGEWYAACSIGGKLPVPYGPAYAANKCNDTGGGPNAVASHPGCVGGVPGLFDMNSNVSELIDDCTGTNCVQRGGDYAGPGSCLATADYPISGPAGSIGFRCCGDQR